MEEQQQNPDSGTSPTPAPPADSSQVQQIRQTVMKQVAELKQQIQLIQQQSLRTMQDTIDSVFRTNTADNLQQLAKQEQDTLQQMKNPPAAGPTPPGTTSYGSVVPDAASQAVAAASQSVQQAMQSANQSVENAEKALSNIGKPQFPAS